MDDEQSKTQSNETVEQDQEEEVSSEVVAEQEHDIELADNEDMKITLLDSKHEWYENAKVKDNIEYTLRIENKQNRTFTLLIDKLKVDGTETIRVRTFFDDNEISPGETRDVTLTTYTEELLDDIQLNIEEHIAGTIHYSDHERSRVTIRFSEYINE